MTRSRSTQVTELQKANDRLASECDRYQSELAEVRSHLETLQQENERYAAQCERLQKSASQERAQLLSTIAQVANLLLRSPDYTTVLPDVVRLLGEAVGSDRCSITQEFIEPQSNKPAVKLLREWCNAEIPSVLVGSPEFQIGVIMEQPPSFEQQLLKGEIVNFLVAEIQEHNARAFFEAHDCVSMLIVPIMVQSKCWGHIGFDSCDKPRVFDEAEIAILRIAADSIAAAIERQAKDDELRKSEALYRSLFEISNEGIYRFEFEPAIPLALNFAERFERFMEDCRITMANLTFAEQMGLASPSEIIGHKVTDFYVENSQLNQQTNEEFLKTLEVHNVETEEIDTHGHRRYILSSAVISVDNDHLIGGWGTQIDITELREAQQALLQAERERVAQLEDYNQQLRSREHWLEATALAANALVSYPTLETALNEALRLIGETVRCDRVAIFQHIHDESGTGFARGIHEWDSQNAFSQLATEHIDFPWSAMGIEDWLIQGQAGELCGGILDELPEPFRSIQAELDVQAIYSVPIFVAGHFWGVLGIDYCREPKRLIAAEVGIFKTIASCIGSAIERQRTQEAILQAEQERSQELERLNGELQQAIDRLSESEERYRTLFEISSEGIYRSEIDPPTPLNLSVDEQLKLNYQNLRVAECNQTFAAMYGYADPQELVDMELGDFYLSESEQNLNMNRMTIENGYRIHNYESEEVDRNGNRRYFLNNIVGIIKDEYVYGNWGSQLDITELRLAQQALLEAEQQRVAELAKTNQALKNSIDRLAADPDLNAFLGHVVLEIIQQLNLHTAWVEFYDPTTQTLQMHLLVEQGTIQLKPNLPDMGYLTQGYVASADAAWNVLCQTKQPLVITLDTLSQFFSADDTEMLRQWAEPLGIQCGINLLLMLGDEPLGELVLFSAERTTFTREELELAQALAQQATLAIALTRLAEESRQLAIIRDRTHLAREIHDTLAQGYAGILMQIQAARFLKQQPDQEKVHLDRACALAREGIADARRSVWLLQQDSEAYGDVSSILVQLVEQMSIGTGIKPTVTIDGTPRSVKPDLGMHLLRMTQESLNNALRHSGASAIAICLQYTATQLQIAIDDNGCGFEIEQLTPGFGIKGIRQRADLIGAQLQIQSQLHQGTHIKFSLPLT